MTRLAVLMMVGLIVLMPLMSGCGIGYTRTIFATKTNVGLEVSSKPPTLELDISRFEGVVSPQFENGKKLPVMASFRFGNTASFSPSVGSAFATGDAATTMAALYADPTPEVGWKERIAAVAGTPASTATDGKKIDKKDFPGDSTLKLDNKPTVMTWLPAWLDWLRPEFQTTVIQKPDDSKDVTKPDDSKEVTKTDVRPVFFGTDTALGIKVAWSGMTGGVPDSAVFGYNRKELALVPISMQKVPVEPPTVPPTYTYHMKQASLLATLDSASEISTGKDGEKGLDSTLIQYFATGDAATLMALQADVRKAMLMRLDPNQKLYKEKFGDVFAKEGDIGAQADVVFAHIYAGLVTLKDGDKGAEAEGHVAFLDALGQLVPDQYMEYASGGQGGPNLIKIKKHAIKENDKKNFKTFTKYRTDLETSTNALEKNNKILNDLSKKDEIETFTFKDESKKPTPATKDLIDTLSTELTNYKSKKAKLDESWRKNKAVAAAINFYAQILTK